MIGKTFATYHSHKTMAMSITEITFHIVPHDLSCLAQNVFCSCHFSIRALNIHMAAEGDCIPAKRSVSHTYIHPSNYILTPVTTWELPMPGQLLRLRATIRHPGPQRCLLHPDHCLHFSYQATAGPKRRCGLC